MEIERRDRPSGPLPFITVEGDERKNALCPPSPYPDTPQTWARMQAVGARSALAFGADEAIRQWAGSVAINPARVPADRQGAPDVVAAQERFARHLGPGLERLSALAGIS